jgi:diguanylate cyclase (GGDEF)-like protein
MAGILIVNLFGKFLFFIDGNGEYHRGALFGSTYVLSYAYVLISWIDIIGGIIKKSSSKDVNQLVLLILFPIAPGISGIVQFYYPWIPAACVALSLTTLLLYQVWIDQLISLDPLTGLNNRKQLLLSFEQWKKTINEQDKIYLLLVDANHFKNINDNYGHLQGDNALKTIAKALRMGCRDYTKRSVIARYGGDEFVVLMASDNEASSKEIKRKIKEKLAEEVIEEQLPFELTVSIGTACMDGDESLKDLIAKADTAMYEEKRSTRK